MAGLGPRVAAVENEIPYSLSYTGVVTYDAFGNIAGQLSRSIALVDQMGNGLVISVLVGRSETLFYAKQVATGPGPRGAVARGAAGRGEGAGTMIDVAVLRTDPG